MKIVLSTGVSKETKKPRSSYWQLKPVGKKVSIYFVASTF